MDNAACDYYAPLVIWDYCVNWGMWVAIYLITGLFTWLLNRD